MQMIMPMAGLGSRFASAGYKVPKPLIPVAGLPMVVRAVRDLPPPERVVCLVHPDHVRDYHIDQTLRDYLPQAQVLPTPGLTRGQACTVRLAATAIDLAQPVLVAACDATHLYDRQQFERLCSDPSIESIIWTYRRQPHVLVSPQSYGWVRTAGDGIDVCEVSCKQPISDQPLKDHVISGFFWFRTAGGLFAAIDRLVEEDRQVRGEYYLDVVPNVQIAAGRRVVVFEVEQYIGWGTPDDLETFQRWERYFHTLGEPTLVRG
jgi:bifunctional N-acetylglucosamine-1-phosphate-uridyltransferase/glucosamine-1-phosphate-acetyltransferase GlmU-like protein